MIVNQPLELTSTKGTFDVSVNVRRRRHRRAGLGDPPRHHARADRSPIRTTARRSRRPAIVTRDPREVERKKYGRHKARKRPQYSKR